MLRNSCILWDCQQRGPKSEMASPRLPSRGPRRGRKCDVTPAFSGILNTGNPNQKWLPHPRVSLSRMPNKGEQNQRRLPLPCLIGGPKEGEMIRQPFMLGDPQRQAHGTISKVVPNKGNKNRSGKLTPAFLGAQKRAKMLLAFSGILNKGDQNQKSLPHRCLLGAQKRAEMLRHPAILGDPQQRGAKSEVAASPLPCLGPKRRQKCYVTSAFWEDLEQRGPKLEVATSPLPSRGRKEGGNATSPLHSGGSPTKGTKIRSPNPTPALS